METIQRGARPYMSANVSSSNLATVQNNFSLNLHSHRQEFNTNSLNLAKASRYFESIWKGREGKELPPGLDLAGTVESEKDSPTETRTSHLRHAYLALLSVQVELMLTNGHSPDRLY